MNYEEKYETLRKMKKREENRRKMKKIMKIAENEEKCEISEVFVRFCLHTQNLRRFPGFAVVDVTFFDETSTISMMFVRNVSLSRRKPTANFGRSPFFR